MSQTGNDDLMPAINDVLKALDFFEQTVPQTEVWLRDDNKCSVTLGDLRRLRSAVAVQKSCPVPGSMLEALARQRIMTIEAAEGGFEIGEACDNYFRVRVTPEQLRALSGELLALANFGGGSPRGSGRGERPGPLRATNETAA